MRCPAGEVPDCSRLYLRDPATQPRAVLRVRRGRRLPRCRQRRTDRRDGRGTGRSGPVRRRLHRSAMLERSQRAIGVTMQQDNVSAVTGIDLSSEVPADGWGAATRLRKLERSDPNSEGPRSRRRRRGPQKRAATPRATIAKRLEQSTGARRNAPKRERGAKRPVSGRSSDDPRERGEPRGVLS